MPQASPQPSMCTWRSVSRCAPPRSPARCGFRTRRPEQPSRRASRRRRPPACDARSLRRARGWEDVPGNRHHIRQGRGRQSGLRIHLEFKTRPDARISGRGSARFDGARLPSRDEASSRASTGRSPLPGYTSAARSRAAVRSVRRRRRRDRRAAPAATPSASPIRERASGVRDDLTVLGGPQGEHEIAGTHCLDERRVRPPTSVAWMYANAPAAGRDSRRRRCRPACEPDRQQPPGRGGAGGRRRRRERRRRSPRGPRSDVSVRLHHQVGVVLGLQSAHVQDVPTRFEPYGRRSGGGSRGNRVDPYGIIVLRASYRSR